nr:hypothetical protein [Tanacetum cinerariifolium]
MPPKSRPLTQSAIERMITLSINEALTANRAKRVNASGAGGFGQGGAPSHRECTFARFMKCNPTIFHGTKGIVVLQRWFEKTKMVFGISECAKGKKAKFAAAILQGPTVTWWNTKYATIGFENGRAEKCEKIDAYIRGLSENINGDVTSSKPANLSEAVRMAHKLMEQKLQAKHERSMKGNKRKWEQ